MKHLPSTLTLICVLLTVISFPIAAQNNNSVSTTERNITSTGQSVISLPPGSPSELLLKYAELGETPYVAEVLRQNPSFDVNRPRAAGNKTALYLASEKGYEDIVKLLLERKADAGICDDESEKGETIFDEAKGKKYSSLTIAAKNGCFSVVKTLLESGIQIDSRDGENRTALYAAVANNHLEVVQFLCESKAEVNIYGDENWTPLTIAAYKGYSEVVKVLMKYGADLEMVCKNRMYKNSTALLCAASDNHPDIVETLCKAGAKVNIYGQCGWVDGWTPLAIAASGGYAKVVNALLKYGQGIDLEMRIQQTPDATPLFTAIGGGNPEVVEMLCEAGADLDFYQSITGKTPLTKAVQKGNIEVIKALLKYGADPYQKDDSGLFGRTAIQQAEEDNRQDIIEILKNPPRLEKKKSSMDTIQQIPAGDKTIVLPGDMKMELVKVEAGTFTMSASDGENDDDEVSHRATLTKDFYIGRTEVTQAQWKAVRGMNPSEYEGDDLPVENVSWNDAMDFCEKLNNMGKAPSGWMFTLPTESQWEFAARGGNKSKGFKYSGSNSIDEVAWYYGTSGMTHPVGQKKANELGLYDMSGNVCEWCLDDWQAKSDKLTAEFTRGNDRGGSSRANRGGSWSWFSDTCRSADRDYYDPGARDSDLGFRVALVPTNSNKSGDSHIAARDSNSSSTTENMSAEAQFNLGWEYYEKKEYSEAVKWFKKAAEQGHAVAQFNLGTAYTFGNGVTRNHAEAVMWYRKAAESGNADAQYNLGICYQNGDGVSKNSSEAFKWFLKAAEQGNANAQHNLGVCYQNGDGVSKNSSEAFKWFLKAAEQGKMEAMFNVGLAYSLGEGVMKNKKEAAAWFSRAAQKDSPAAQFYLGVCYENGDGVSKDLTQAAYYYLRAAVNGVPEAQYNIGLFYIYGKGVPQDTTNGIMWFRTAAENGSVEARNALRILGY